ncbi:hypothetical protein EDD27_9201 [Nonomuraea polychroma]|uniref:Uncharacterized protein n=1 Tax=Nonomuraea polychroma TaxID=46176 RepID=A0A438ML52_9ACTN|nr:hypothetical protein EDD27_9201 [Nonomuraea polychroma]
MNDFRFAVVQVSVIEQSPGQARSRAAQRKRLGESRSRAAQRKRLGESRSGAAEGERLGQELLQRLRGLGGLLFALRLRDAVSLVRRSRLRMRSSIVRLPMM